MVTSLDTLTLEVERLTGHSIIPVNIDRRIYFTPIAVVLILLVFRPSFLYKDKKFSFLLFLWYVFLISALVVGGFYAYEYRRFF